jgi:hypothetical protein
VCGGQPTHAKFGTQSLTAFFDRVVVFVEVCFCNTRLKIVKSMQHIFQLYVLCASIKDNNSAAPPKKTAARTAARKAKETDHLLCAPPRPYKNTRLAEANIQHD